MRPLLLSLTLCGCGPLFIEPVADDTPVTTAGGDLPVACVDRCLRVTEQLVRDFGVPRERIQCSAQFGGALTCAACQERFVSTFGVRLTSCP